MLQPGGSASRSHVMLQFFYGLHPTYCFSDKDRFSLLLSFCHAPAGYLVSVDAYMNLQVGL